MTDLTLAIAGLGAIGQQVARTVDAGEVPGVRLVAASARNKPAAAERLSDLTTPPAITGLAELADLADIVLECAPAEVFAELAVPAIERGRILMPLSVGAFLNHPELVDRAKETGGRIIVPTGALIGLDTVRAMAEGKIYRVSLQTRKPPQGLRGAPWLVENGIEIDNLAEAKLVFEGSARDAAKAFPANVNVAAALALAGAGPDATTVEVWADPSVDRNIQTVSISSDSGDATMTIRNIPSEANPKTGRITALSAIAALRRLTSPMTAGT